MPKNKKSFTEGMIPFSDSFAELANFLTSDEIKYPFDSFDSFVQEIISKSYPKYNYNTWHIRLMCSRIDKVLNLPPGENKYFLAVLARLHLKSFTLGYCSQLYQALKGKGDEGLFLTYKSELANYHLSKIKTVVNLNPYLSKIMVDLSPQSDYTVYYKIASKKIRIFGDGIFSVSRGRHPSNLLNVDDVIGDVLNPLLLGEIQKVKDKFYSEVIPLATKECPIFVTGTAIDYSDLLFDLMKNEEFARYALWLPAINPDSEHEVFWESMYNRDWLEKKRALNSKAFSTEFLLTPLTSMEAFITREDLDRVVDKSLKNYNLNIPFNNKGSRNIVAGFDVGKRLAPSCLAVFIDDENENLKMIHCSFWDHMDYEIQIERLLTIIDNFNIDKLYYDNTRSELEDRGLPKRVCVPIKFTGRGNRNQQSFANDFAKRVEKGTVAIIDDDRLISQIVCVNNALKAVESPMGHGDGMWGCALAMGAYQDFYATDRKKGASNLGDMNELLGGGNRDVKNSEGACKVCKGIFFEDLPDGRKKCLRCLATW